jgi:hypothetical protein
MSNLTKLEFNALDISGKNYLAWILDAEIHLNAMDLGDTIKEENTSSEQNKAKAMIFLRHHIHEGLKTEYLTVKDPAILWKDLKERYDHQKTVILPKARFDWLHLRLQDFKSVCDYNSAIFKITSQMKLCGENITDKDMLEKTFSTFHASNMLLQQQYRERGFTKYSELISCLLVAEQNNELLMKNHNSRPTGSTPFPEANVVTSNEFEPNQQHFRGRGRGQGYGRDRGHHNEHRSNFKNKAHNHLKWKPKENTSFKKTDSTCHRCGGKGHWSRTCRTPKHLVDLYQASLKGKGVETNFTEQNDPMDLTHLEVGDFFEDTNGEFDKLISDGKMA